MKFLAVAITLVAAVSAEADADAYYAPYFAPYAYGAYTFGGKSAPCVNAANVPVPCAGAPYAYHGYPYAAHYYGKRSADAEPEADADAYYGYYGYARPYAYGYRSYGYGYPYRYGYYGKRSADAEPEAEADPALLYTTSHVVNPVTSYVAGSPLVYNTHPVTSVNNVPVVKAAVNTVPVVNTVYNAAVHTPVVKTVATTPVVYNTAVHHPVVYNTAVHTPLVNTVYNTLPLTHSLVNTVPAATTTVSKREAEADPALVYTTGLTTPYVHHVAQPVVYNTAVHHPVTYAAPVVKAPAHGLALTAAGYTHSSNVGVCLNNMGVQVPC